MAKSIKTLYFYIKKFLKSYFKIIVQNTYLKTQTIKNH